MTKMTKKMTAAAILLLCLAGCSSKDTTSTTDTKTTDSKVTVQTNDSEEKTADSEEKTADSEETKTTDSEEKVNDSEEENKDKEVESHNQEFGKSTVVDGMEIEVNKLDSSDIISDGEKRILYSFEVRGKNVSSTAKGLGAIDFVLITENGDTYEIDDTISNFGSELKQGEEIKEVLYFSVESDKKVKKIEYKPLDKPLVSWEIN